MALPAWLPQFEKRGVPTHGWDCYPAWETRNGRKTPVLVDADPAGMLHSTETTELPSYNSIKTGRSGNNPTVTVDPWRRRRYQHVRADWASRALVTGNAACVQVEIVGYCDAPTARRRGHEDYLLDRLDDEGMAYLAESLRILGDACGIPATSTVPWKAYPSSYGDRNGIRLPEKAFRAYRGWLGHQHAPGNLHGDPGDLDVARLLELMNGTSSTAAPSPQPRKPAVKQITVDGIFGPGSTEALQALAGVEQDGVLSGQPRSIRTSKAVGEALDECWPTLTYGKGGSRTIAWLQRKVGAAPADGVLGPGTRRALQRKAGAKADGIPGPATVRATQEWINKQLKEQS